MQDMFYSQTLNRFAFAKGVGAAAPETPRVNFTGEPYWTDGFASGDVALEPACQLPKGGIGRMGTSAAMGTARWSNDESSLRRCSFPTSIGAAIP
jgi:hypothetical protein